ncbi:hypothetical protein OGAPHI_000870 [Ogataea philodendri]|uniref:Cytochrome P450 n=1 Tax=Ogataea philodendri TaxID=1378263 RepID=A0A9P8PH56_9ASCO|nr:uncharacterized protein OGAPHI_000870 [Ogataea philodendri]KAH3671159.1 hypothetical protein OGAPHI_000870 [Ogataea philodendri]
MTLFHAVGQQSWLFLVELLIGGFVLYLYLFNIRPATPKIRNLPELPGWRPFWGHLKQLGSDHSTKLQQLSIKHNIPVFQCLFGNQRIIFINSYEAANEWFIKNQSVLKDRPVFYTFHKLVSTSQGLTIGTSPWNDECKRRRLNVQRYMTTPAIQERAGLIDVEVYSLLRDMYRDTQVESCYPYPYTQRLALNFTTMLCYATRFDDIKNSLLEQILSIVRVISSFRSTNQNFQDFIPFLRFLPENSRRKAALHSSKTRDEWLTKLTNEALNHKDSRPSIVGDFAKDTETSRLNLDDVKSICVGLVSGGFETVGSTSALIMAQLVSEKGPEWQEKIYNECLAHYSSVQEAWGKVLLEQKCEFSNSFIRELLRMYAVIPLLPARKTIKSFTWNGASIPAGETVILNAQAANHDKSRFGPTADEFMPERFLNDPDIDVPPYHFTFGAGSRACTAVNLSVRILYVILTRTCMAFTVRKDASRQVNTDYIGFAQDRTAQTNWPKDFGVYLEPRDPKTVDACFSQSKMNCQELLSYSIEYDK